ncbi:uncharacterized protein F5147DRAFT_776611 [Suillus discolor]|uniref:CCHC-type domain-containing protein n=1 Tax=Suillus discolor TaxID=1912936 RepID=A0A9P7F1W2_9AGAM|nr:uncharacterized protein F5147DRAFT_776611 [Suillus discolor]KAG2101609.1 hypothetical protein F5147DRAFT_776611 [Suillus discolor]
MDTFLTPASFTSVFNLLWNWMCAHVAIPATVTRSPTSSSLNHSSSKSFWYSLCVLPATTIAGHFARNAALACARVAFCDGPRPVHHTSASEPAEMNVPSSKVIIASSVMWLTAMYTSRLHIKLAEFSSSCPWNKDGEFADVVDILALIVCACFGIVVGFTLGFIDTTGGCADGTFRVLDSLGMDSGMPVSHWKAGRSIVFGSGASGNESSSSSLKYLLSSRSETSRFSDSSSSAGSPTPPLLETRKTLPLEFPHTPSPDNPFLAATLLLLTPSPRQCVATLPSFSGPRLPALQILSLSAKPSQVPLTAPISLPLPQIAPVQMSTSTYRMPLHGTNATPKFDGTTTRLLAFLEDVSLLGNHASLGNEAHIKAAICYAPIEESKTWEMLDEAAGTSWKKFYDALKLLYPGCEGDHHYTQNDLENLCAKQLHITIHMHDEFGVYYQSFLKLSKFLIMKKKLAELECNKLFLDGIHETTNTIIRRHLEIKMVDHHSDEPYLMDQVYTTAVFLLSRTMVVVTTSVASPLPRQLTHTTTMTMVTTSAPAAQPSVTVMQPSGGIVVKKEYNLQSTLYECYFCGGKNHIAKWCNVHQEYISSGKIIENEGKVYMPDSSGIPGSQEDRYFKQWIDKYVGQTPVTRANTIQVQAKLYYCAALNIEIIAEIDSSAFLHTCTNEEYVAFTAKCARRSNKGKTARFEGIEVPLHPKPGPLSKVTEQVEEIVSPEVREAKAKKVPNPGTVVVKPAMKATTATSVAPVASTLMATLATQTAQYHYAFPLEDREAEKCVMDRILNMDVNVPIWDLTASSSDIRKALKDLTTSKHVMVGMVSVNELSSLPQMEQFLKGWDKHMKRANDGCIVANHFKAL